VIAPCTTQIPVQSIPAQVTVVRGGSQLASPPSSLQVGDEIRVPSPRYFTFSYAGNTYTLWHGDVSLQCRAVLLRPGQARASVLAVTLQYGRMRVVSGAHPRRALVISPELLAFATRPRTTFFVQRYQSARRTKAWTKNRPIVAAKAADQTLRINTRITYTAISDSRGLRLDIWPFPISPLQRRTTRADGLPAYWADGQPCSVGCTTAVGWPLAPFHRQHAIRAGINELRPANFHVAVDIEAHNFQNVYAIQSGVASIRYPGTGDVNVDVGNFYYWHINPTVSNGQYVTAFKTVIGRVLYGFYHVALSEGSTARYLNPLRPGGSLRPYTNTEPPIIGVPRIFSDGKVIVGAFGPQSVVATGFPYETPVLAPSSLAWRLYDARGHALTGLQWAMRGSQNYPPSLKPVIFAPGAANPGFDCFFRRKRCIPNWVYWLAGGLTPPLSLASLPRGRYRLTVYAWDWANNTSALDYSFNVPLAGAAAAPGGPLQPQFDYDESGASRNAPPAAPSGANAP
jgi:hypothetical protein